MEPAPRDPSAPGTWPEARGAHGAPLADRGAVAARAAAAAPIETDALVIGAGPAGLFQVFQLGLLEIRCHVVDALPRAGGQCVQLYADKPIYDIPGTPRTTGRALVDSLLEQVAPFAPVFHFGTQVRSMERQPDGRLLCGTTSGLRLLARCVFIAAGVGAFLPRKLAGDGLEAFEGTHVFYHPETLDDFTGRRVVVAGDHEEAVAAALALRGRAASVTLLHRRDQFHPADADLAAFEAARQDGSLSIAIGQPLGYDGTTLRLAAPDGRGIDLAADVVAAYLGISPRLGPIADWGLDLAKKQLVVDPERFQTREPGVFAIGDANHYPGKKKLIVCAFHEATLAAWAAAELVFPDGAPPLQYTTTSTRLHELLGVASAT